jgi:protein phosphatase
VALRRLGPESLLLMPDDSIRLFDLDVAWDASAGPDVRRRHGRELASVLYYFCPPENDQLRSALARAGREAGSTDDVVALVEEVDRRGGARPLSTRATAFSDLGLVRSGNEDRWGWSKLGENAWLYVVADGVGGHEAGEVAAELAVRTVIEQVTAVPADARVESVQQTLVKAFEAANEAVLDYGLRRRVRPGCTLAAAVVLGNRLVVANVGDSRVYRFRTGRLEPITTDHSMVQALVDKGSISREDARKHPRARMLTCSVGAPPEDFEVDTFAVELSSGDHLMLCTDGMWSEVPEERIARLLGAIPSRREAVTALVREAWDGGGEDNLTLILVDVG